MEILNPGHIVPIYANLQSQHHNRPGCEHSDFAIPIQQGEFPSIQFEVSPGTEGQWTWAYEYEGNMTTHVLSASLLRYSETIGNSRAWLGYNADAITLERDCVVYWFVFANTTTGQNYYSERFRIVGMNNAKERIYRLDFSHSTDIDGALYQGAYAQKVWFQKAVFDTPEITEQTEKLVDGDSVETVVFQSVQRREVLRFPNVPDFWQGVLQRLRLLDNVVLTKIQTGETWDIAGKDITFTSDEQDICFKRGTFTWISSAQVMGECETNISLEILENDIIG